MTSENQSVVVDAWQVGLLSWLETQPAGVSVTVDYNPHPPLPSPEPTTIASGSVDRFVGVPDDPDGRLLALRAGAEFYRRCRGL